MDDWSSLVAASAVAVVDRDLIECRLCSLVGLALIGLDVDVVCRVAVGRGVVDAEAAGRAVTVRLRSRCANTS